MIWALAFACSSRVPLAALAERPVELATWIPEDRTVNVAILDARVRGRGADRNSNDWLQVAQGVRVQCELYRRVAAASLFVDRTAEPGEHEATCPIGGVLLPLRLRVE